MIADYEFKDAAQVFGENDNFESEDKEFVLVKDWGF